VTRRFTVGIDYAQFVVRDADADVGALGERPWDEEALARGLAVEPGHLSVAVGDVRDAEVEVEIAGEPAPVSGWAREDACELDVGSGMLLVSQLLVEPRDAEPFRVDPGRYRVRVLWGEEPADRETPQRMRLELAPLR
jgi:hypothetical protein